MSIVPKDWARDLIFRKRSPKKAIPIVCCCAIALPAILVAPVGSAAAANWTLRKPPLPRWHLEEGGTASSSLLGVSCPTESLCVAVGSQDSLVFSQEPTGGAGAWHVVNPSSGKPCPEGEPQCRSGGGLKAVSCASQSLCVVVSYEGFIFATTEPTGGATAWAPTDINEAGGHGGTHLTGVSCPSASLCVAVSSGPSLGDTAGRILTSTDPIAGNWRVAQLAGSPDLRGVSCGTPSLCVAVARGGQIFVSTDPTGGASAWRAVGTPGGPGDLEGVSCVASSLCAAGNANGNMLTSTNPTGSAAGWSGANAGGSVAITGASCPAVSRCVAVDNNGDALTSTDPTGGPGSWRFENLVPYGAPAEFQSPGNALFGASCPSTSLCALVGADGRVFTSTEPFAAPTDPAGGSKGRKAPKRPRTTILFASPFWEVTVTRRRHVRADFHFFSPTKTRGFECKRDRGHYRRCHSPLRYWVGQGGHVLRVRAVGPTGLRGPVATKRFRVTRPRGRSHS